MKSHRRRRRRRRIRALVLGLAACTAVAAPAGAQQIGDTPADYPGTQATPTIKIGDTPADFAQPVAPALKTGDTPADYPGMPDAPGAGNFAEPAPTLTEAPDTGGFDWTSAAIGAGGAGMLIVVSLGGMALASRRRMSVAR